MLALNSQISQFGQSAFRVINWLFVKIQCISAKRYLSKITSKTLKNLNRYWWDLTASQCYVISNIFGNINNNLPWPLVELIKRSSKKLVRNKTKNRPWPELFLDDIFARVCQTDYVCHCRLCILFLSIAYLIKKEKKNPHVYSLFRVNGFIN